MEFLFLNHSSSLEALIIFLSLVIIVILIMNDVIAWFRRKLLSLNPRKAYTLENSNIEMQDLSTLIHDTPTSTDTNTGDTGVTVEAEKGMSPPLESSNIESEVISGDTGDSQEELTQSATEDPAASTEDLLNSREGEKDQTSDNNILRETGSEVAPHISIKGAQDDDKIESTGIQDKNEGENPQTLDVNLEAVKTEDTPTETLLLTESIGVSPLATSEPIEPSQAAHQHKLSSSKREKLVEMVNSVKTLIARGHIDDARALIVNGLAIDKSHIELNLLMAQIYERDHAFEKAEYILKDVAQQEPENPEILTRLATVVAMQRKYEVAYELYKKVLSIEGDREDTLYTLTHIASELARTDDLIVFAKSYLKQYPKNPEILWLYSQALITAGERREAIEILIKLKNLTPYNQEIVDLIGKLVTEEELAGNFGEEKN